MSSSGDFGNPLRKFKLVFLGEQSGKYFPYRLPLIFDQYCRCIYTFHLINDFSSVADENFTRILMAVLGYRSIFLLALQHNRCDRIRRRSCCHRLNVAFNFNVIVNIVRISH